MRRHRGVLGKIRWHLNDRLTRQLWVLNLFGARLTVVDAYGAPGDTLLTAIVCRHVRARYPRLRLNCLTPNPDLLQHDPSLETVGAAETFFSVWSWYPETAGRRDGDTNVLRETFARLGMQDVTPDYRARVHLTDAERARGRALIAATDRPVLTFHTRTNEPVKDWPLDRWRAALADLGRRFHLVHLGDAREPQIEGVQRLAGALTFRESMGVLAHARVHVGADSFLMHAANGLDVPSVIVFGGSRTPANVGYAANVNLFAKLPCGPCWIHAVNGERCTYGLACMEAIAPAAVVDAVVRLAGVTHAA
jgi:ADP-heptose:LPS heptosyltransferase